MFDPSKLNIDLENIDKKELNNSDTTDPKNTEEKVDIFSEDTNTNDNKQNKTESKNSDENYEDFKEKIDSSDKKQEEKDKESEKTDDDENNEQQDNKEKEEQNKDKNNQENTEQDNNEENQEEKIIFDININSLNDLIKYLLIKKYDFFVIEPEDDKVKISFRKDKAEKEIKYIKYPTYTNILLKIKSTAKLDLTETQKEQENKAKITYNGKSYGLIVKTKPSNLGEKVFFKMKEIAEKRAVKKEKMSFGKLMGIVAGLLFIAILLGIIFIAIVIFNSDSVSDLKFFLNLGIDADKVKDFAANLVNGFFGGTVIIEIIFLFYFIYKFFLTKKVFVKEKRKRLIIAIFFLMISIITFLSWLFLYKKILTLKGRNYGQIEYFDNSKLISGAFNKKSAKLDITKPLIGPVTIRFDNKEFIQKIKDGGFTPEIVTWIIDKQTYNETINSNIFIHKFQTKGLHNIQIQIQGTNIKKEQETKIKDLGKVNISNIVNISRKKLDDGAKYIFDASDLSNLGKIYWYYIPNLEGKSANEQNTIIAKALKKEKLIGYTFNSKNIFEGEEYYAIKVISGDKTEQEIQNTPLSKVFVVGENEKNEILGTIETIKDKENYKKYNIFLKNPQTKFGSAYIKKYIWKIEDFNNKGNKEIFEFKKDANLLHLQDSSEITYTFKKSGKHKIYLQILDSEGKLHNIKEKKVEIAKKIALRNRLEFFSTDVKKFKDKKNLFYDESVDLYSLEDLKAPGELQISAEKLKALNPKYTLNKVSWDLDGDGNFEKIAKSINYKIYTKGFHKIYVKYEFLNILNTDEKIYRIQQIAMNAKERIARLSLDIINDISYVPVIVKFDATKSKVLGKDIDKFIFDYGDGTKPEARDGKNAGHKYIKAGDYTVKLTVITVDGSKYSITKKLELKDRPQKASIKTSLKTASVFQPIDFNAENSIGEIGKYFWDFGDTEISTQASPSHFYRKAGKYKVKLALEYTNGNVLYAEKEIIITE